MVPENLLDSCGRQNIEHVPNLTFLSNHSDIIHTAVG